MSPAQQIKGRILVLISDSRVNKLLENILLSSGYEVIFCEEQNCAQKAIELKVPTLMMLGEKLRDGNGLNFAQSILKKYPGLPIILFVERETPEILKEIIRCGIADYLCLPLRVDDILTAVENALSKAHQNKQWVLLEAKRATASLQRKVDELETMTQLGHHINGSLDLDSVLSSIVDAAVELTGAEEGSLLLLDEETGELYMRASRNFQEEFVRTFRLPTQDTLAGSVIQSGEAILLDESSPTKIKTAYLVHSLVYVPISKEGRVFGVLGVDNRQKHLPFTARDVKLLSAIAEFAVTAIENARSHENTLLERNKLSTILSAIEDLVIVVDDQNQLVLVNDAARSVFGLEDEDFAGKHFRDVFSQQELVELVESSDKRNFNWLEVSLEGDRVYSTQIAPIPNLGMAITLNDITYLKRLDIIKTEFVNTVSHDLRSPLTAIMGYVDLIERTGSVSEMQHDFIRRVQISVQNITNLVDDLLLLGRVEADADAMLEDVFLDQLINFVSDQFADQIKRHKHEFSYDHPDNFMPVRAHPTHIQHMVENLLDNAIKYTPQGGVISVSAKIEKDQAVMQIRDTGIGIPSLDLPYIFDKFYRASNVDSDTVGTGLGLSIVKAIVDNHSGRIWVDSKLGQGSTFTVVFPLKKA